MELEFHQLTPRKGLEQADGTGVPSAYTSLRAPDRTELKEEIQRGNAKRKSKGETQKRKSERGNPKGGIQENPKKNLSFTGAKLKMKHPWLNF